MFGDLPRRFPAAWHVLSLLGNSPCREIVCDLPVSESQPMDSSSSGREVQRHTVIMSGIDPRLDAQLLEMLERVKAREMDLFFSPSFKSITRNPRKLLSIIDTVLRYGGTVLTPNYVLSPSYLARRDPMLHRFTTLSSLRPNSTMLQGLANDTGTCWLRWHRSYWGHRRDRNEFLGVRA